MPSNVLTRGSSGARGLARLLSAGVIGLSIIASGSQGASLAQPDPTTNLVFVLQRNNRLSVFDADRLELRGYYVTGGLGDGMVVRRDGRMAFLNQPMSSDPHSCCSLAALDLETGRMCHLTDFADTPYLDGDVVVSGSRAFDARTLAPIGWPARTRQAVAPAPAVAPVWPRPAPRRPQFVAAGSWLIAFDRYGAGLKMANEPPGPAGAFVVDPATGRVQARLLTEFYVRDLVASSDGNDLYAIEDWPRGDPVRFARVDRASGRVVTETMLHPATGGDGLVEEWTLAFVTMPTRLVPRGEVAAKPCR